MRAAPERRLFSRKLSDRYEYARARTPEYEFLNRSPRKAVEAIRRLAEDWISRIPASERQRMIAGMQSRRDAEHWSAFFELYCHELLVRAGYTVLMHPQEAGGRAKDFRASRESLTVEVEAVVCTDSDANRTQDDIRDQVLDYLDEYSFVPGFRYSIDIVTSGANLPSLSGLATKIKSWASEFNRAVIRKAYEESGAESLPTRAFSGGGWSIEITLIPRPRDEEDNDQFKKAIGIGPIFGGELHHDRAFRNALKRKAVHYSEFPFPFVIAVDTIFSFPMHDEIDVLQALLGTEQLSFDSRTLKTIVTRAPDGVWLGPGGPRNRDISGVIVVEQLRSWYVAKAPIVIYANPWANKPIPPDSLNVRRISWDLSTGRRIESPGLDGANIFGLSSDWPEEA